MRCVGFLLPFSTSISNRGRKNYYLLLLHHLLLLLLPSTQFFAFSIPSFSLPLFLLRHLRRLRLFLRHILLLSFLLRLPPSPPSPTLSPSLFLPQSLLYSSSLISPPFFISLFPDSPFLPSLSPLRSSSITICISPSVLPSCIPQSFPLPSPCSLYHLEFTHGWAHSIHEIHSWDEFFTFYYLTV
jgi:hypothetical protein